MKQPPTVVVLTVTVDQLEELVRRAVADALATHAPSSASEWIAVRSCGIPPTTRRRLTREGTLPTSKVGRDLMVRRADVARYIDSQRTDQPREGDELDRTLRLVASKGAAR